MSSLRLLSAQSLTSRPPSRRLLGSVDLVGDRDEARVLVIELPAGSEGQRLCDFVREQQIDWLAEAAADGRSLAIVIAPDAIELYSTAGDIRCAVRPVMKALKELTVDEPSLSKLRTVELSSREAEEHLLFRAAGLRCKKLGDSRVGTAIHQPAALTTASGALCPALGALFWAAAATSRRILEEMAVALPVSDVYRLAAERIVAEELLALKVRRGATRQAKPRAGSDSECESYEFSSEEHASSIRLRAACDSLTPTAIGM